ncbi:MAG: DUF4339 domain-containing protein [Verrucomicrobiales bacterium]
MYCSHPSCQKDVDINSVAETKIHGAGTYDFLDSDINPSVVSSSSGIVNICKSCGESDYLFVNKEAYKESLRLEKLEKESREFAKKRWRLISDNPIYLLGFGFVFSLVYMIAAFVEHKEFWFYKWNWTQSLWMLPLNLAAALFGIITFLLFLLAIVSTPRFLINGGTKGWRKRAESMGFVYETRKEPYMLTNASGYYEWQASSQKWGGVREKADKLKEQKAEVRLKRKLNQRRERRKKMETVGYQNTEKNIKTYQGSKLYYYHDAVNGEVKGPFSLTDIKSLREKNAINDQTQICEQGSDNWIPYQYKELK